MQEGDLLPVQVIIPTVADSCIPTIKQKVCLNYACVIYNLHFFIIILKTIVLVERVKQLD